MMISPSHDEQDNEIVHKPVRKQAHWKWGLGFIALCVLTAAIVWPFPHHEFHPGRKWVYIQLEVGGIYDFSTDPSTWMVTLRRLYPDGRAQGEQRVLSHGEDPNEVELDGKRARASKLAANIIRKTQEIVGGHAFQTAFESETQCGGQPMDVGATILLAYADGSRTRQIVSGCYFKGDSKAIGGDVEWLVNALREIETNQ